MNMMSYFLGRAAILDAVSGGCRQYTSIVYNEDNTITLTDTDGIVHTMSCTYGDGKLIGVTYDGKAVDLTYNGDALVKVGKTAVDMGNAPATSGGGSVVKNAITSLASSDGILIMASVVKFADTVDFNSIHIENAIITSVKRNNDYALEIVANITNVMGDTVKITTDKGVFFDENIVTENYAAVGIDYPLIPKMTGNNTPSGSITSGNYYSTSSGQLYYAFDGNNSTCLEYLKENVKDGYISYQFDNTVYISQIVAKFGNYASSNNISATLYIDNIEIGTVNVSGYKQGTFNEFSFSVNRSCTSLKFVFGYKEPGTNIMTYGIQAYGFELT